MIIDSNLFKKTLYRKLKLIHKFFTIGLILLISQNAFSAQDDYLRQLEAEMDDEIEESSTVETKSNNNSEQELILNKKQLVNDQKSFEQALNDSFPESYALYQDMDDKQKKNIYDDFKKYKRLYNASVKIISTYLSTH